jgi:hypothetical protein
MCVPELPQLPASHSNSSQQLNPTSSVTNALTAISSLPRAVILTSLLSFRRGPTPPVTHFPHPDENPDHSLHDLQLEFVFLLTRRSSCLLLRHLMPLSCLARSPTTRPLAQCRNSTAGQPSYGSGRIFLFISSVVLCALQPDAGPHIGLQVPR